MARARRYTKKTGSAAATARSRSMRSRGHNSQLCRAKRAVFDNALKVFKPENL
jgi:hypothetical protein